MVSCISNLNGAPLSCPIGLGFVRVSDYGDFATYDDYYRHTRYINMKYPEDSFESSFTYHNLVTSRSRRDGYSNNPTFTIPGTTTKWRSSTGTYQNSSVSFSRTNGTWTSRGPVSVTYEDDIPSNTYTDKNLFHPPIFDPNIPDVVWQPELENQSISKATQKMKDNKVGLGEDLAQANQTVRLLYDSGKFLLDAAFAVRNGDLGLARRLLGDVRAVVKTGSNVWLQFQYGWRPLMSDIFGLANLLQEQTHRAMIVRSVSNSSLNPTFSGGEEAFGSGSLKCHVVLYSYIDSTGWHYADQLGLTNPLTLAWNLIPYSFVVDWFVPVGSVIDTWSKPTGLNFLAGYCSQRAKVSVHGTQRPPLGVSEDSPRMFSHKGEAFKRKVYSDWPIAGLYAKNNPFSDAHLASTFALLAQRFL